MILLQIAGAGHRIPEGTSVGGAVSIILDKLKKLKKYVKSLEEKSRHIDKAKKELLAVKKELVEAKKQLVEKDDRLVKSEIENGRLKEDNKDLIQTHQTEIDIERCKKTELEKELSNLQQEKGDIASTLLAEQLEFQQATEDLTTKLSLLQGEKNDLAMKLAEEQILANNAKVHLEEKIKELTLEMEGLVRDHANTLAAERSASQSEIDRLHGQNSTLARQKQNVAEDCESRLRQQEYQHAEAFRTQEDWWNGQVRAKETEFQRQLEETQRQQREALALEQQTNKENLESERADHIREERELQAENARLRAKWEARYEKKMIEMQTEIEKVRVEWQLEYGRKEEELQGEYEKMKREMQAVIDRLTEERRDIELRCTKAAKVEQKKLQQEWGAERMRLRSEIEEYKDELIARVRVKGLPDDQLTRRFKRIAGQIDILSRLPWDAQRENDWPYPEHMLKQYSNNTRKLKQQIVQNSLWMLLHEVIFRSPFRIMGDAGRRLDADWIDIYAQSR